jgi:glycerol-3-phosphate acyltransferase PlsX
MGIESVSIAIDCMGGDKGISATMPAALSFLKKEPSVRLLLVGDCSRLGEVVAGWDINKDRYEVIHAGSVISMDDPPAVALRSKKDSSMRLALNQVRDGRAHACVSSGNTGALMVLARAVLKTLDGIDRPAIASSLPNQKGRFTTVLDLGANVDCSADHLVQFALMGLAYHAALFQEGQPSVGLLNVGEEIIKGTAVVKEAGERLREMPVRFFGNVEGNDIFKGTSDVVVCDGFVGNVALKTIEGLAQMLGQFLKEEFSSSVYGKISGLVALPVLNGFKRRVDPRRYNGAAFLGLNGVVLKSHGGADHISFLWALERAYQLIQNKILEKTSDVFRHSYKPVVERGV